MPQLLEIVKEGDIIQYPSFPSPPPQKKKEIIKY